MIARLKGAAIYDALLQRQRPQPGGVLDVPHSVVGTGNGFVAAVGGAADCQGTLVYVDEQPLTCAEGAGSPVFSPDGSQLILARKTGETGPVDSPTIESIGLDIYDILVLDVTTGQERILAQGALGSEFSPHVVWNAAGTHILVRWPFHGYGP